MHELSIAQEIIRIAEQYIDEENSKIKSVRVKIGKLQNVLVDSLEFCFDGLIPNSRLSGSKLIVEKIPLVVECKRCKKISESDEYIFICKHCGGNNIDIKTGNELTISEIEFE